MAKASAKWRGGAQPDIREILARIVALQEAEADRATDPTANVLREVQQTATRLDDLREAADRRQGALTKQERRHRKEIRSLETKYRDSQYAAEKNRIDAQLADAKNAVAIAAQRTELTATALAERVDTSAKALAVTVETTAKTLAAATDAIATAIGLRLAPLEQARFESGGAKEQRAEVKQDNRWLLGLVLGIPGFLLAIVAVVGLFRVIGAP
jgi:hypothetical protein